MTRRLALSLLFFIAVLGCGTSSNQTTGLTPVSGFEVRIWASDFAGPTQMVFASNGDLVIAELNGPENAAMGRVLRVSAGDPTERVVLQEALDKPTGIAIAGDRLWIMERQRLSVTTLEPGADRAVVADDLPSNGRSEGTLTVTPDGRLLYDTSGSKRGPERVPGSGTLFAIDDAAGEPSDPRVIATGFKHAYAHVIDADDQLWSVEMTDGKFDGVRASDELVAITTGDDAGWPQCVDDNRPVVEYGGTPEICALSPRSHALLGPGATPTSIVIAPWDPDMFVITLWLRGEVVTVPRSASRTPHEPTLLLAGIESPQHLVADGDELLVSDHETGRIFAIASTS